MKTFLVTTLGCKVNRYESEALSEKMEDRGWRCAEKEETANICIINTCTVTGKAAMQSRQAVRKTIRNHPGSVIVVTGCYAQTAPHILADISGVDWVIDNANKHRLLEVLDNNVWEDSKGHDCNSLLTQDIREPLPFHDLPLSQFGDRTRAFVKIQDGCDAFCSYCIVPFARGRSRSLKPEVVIERIATLTKKGFLEIVLCGIHIGRYGYDLTPATSLSRLFQALENVRGLKRVRLSSIEPMELTDDIIQAIETTHRICPHLHIPLQSGDNAVLKAMNRPYKARFYRDLMRHLVHTVPNVSIGVDVMAGFPGESEKAFDKTYQLIEELPIAYLHVFPFSLHKGTAAEKLGKPVPSQTIKKRCRRLRLLGQRKKEAFFRRFIGTEQELLVEGKKEKNTGYLKGFTTNYIPVHIQGNDELYNKVVGVKLEKVEKGHVLGRLLSR